MEFGPVPLAQAQGAILAHSVPLAKGRLRKGKCLTSADIAALAAAGITHPVVARLGADDLHEDRAAMALAEALVPEPGAAGLVVQPVGTGRVNLLAAGAGLARIDAARIDAINAADDSITLATVPEWQRMAPGGMVATIKIISYGVEKAAIDRACLEAVGALSLVRPVLRRVAMIETLTGKDALSEAVSDKGARVTAERLARLGADLLPVHRVAHDEAALARALAAAPDEAELLLILTASATSDLRDTAPAALRRAGGVVEHFGMPVDPGNLLFLGRLGARPVIGLPGCARSPALNGADWVLERVICGVPVGAEAIRRMGVGGLLKEIPSRPRPRQRGVDRAVDG